MGCALGPLHPLAAAWISFFLPTIFLSLGSVAPRQPTAAIPAAMRSVREIVHEEAARLELDVTFWQTSDGGG